MKRKEYTRDEVIKILDEWGAKQSYPFTAAEMLSGKVSISRLNGHEIYPWVVKYRGKISGLEKGRRLAENYFDPNNPKYRGKL